MHLFLISCFFHFKQIFTVPLSSRLSHLISSMHKNRNMNKEKNVNCKLNIILTTKTLSIGSYFSSFCYSRTLIEIFNCIWDKRVKKEIKKKKKILFLKTYFFQCRLNKCVDKNTDGPSLPKCCAVPCNNIFALFYFH